MNNKDPSDQPLVSAVIIIACLAVSGAIVVPMWMARVKHQRDAAHCDQSCNERGSITGKVVKGVCWCESTWKRAM